jgi:hypothetical protein
VSYEKKIVCLAASRKPGGLCMAGKEKLGPHSFGDWIRPVSSRPGEEIDVLERRYANGIEPRLLDIIEIPMLVAVPRVHQQENQMIDPEQYWVKKGVVSWEDLEEMEDTPPTLWANESNTFHGRFDRVTVATAARLRTSLYLIKPTDVTIIVLAPGAAFGNPKRAVRADFHFNGAHYNFQVTDPVTEVFYKAKPDGEYPLEQDAYFCVSLAEAHTDNFCYKLVAGVMTENPL